MTATRVLTGAELCAAIRQARTARGWSQPLLARLARVSSHIITHIERGVLPARFEPLAKIVRTLELDERTAFEIWWREVGAVHVGR